MRLDYSFEIYVIFLVQLFCMFVMYVYYFYNNVGKLLQYAL